MLEELETAIKDYEQKWNKLIDSSADKIFFDGLLPTSVGWKTEDLADFDRRFAELRELCDQVHLGWVNDRWIATLHLTDKTLPLKLTVIKLMQRRPGSSDATGIDHLDFYFHPGEVKAKDVLQN